jgi:hypothetical protein
MAYRALINKVLTRLREDTISANWSGAISDSTTLDDYEILIGELVNEAKEVVEDAWNWSVLRSIVPITTSSDTPTYTITGANDRSRVLQVIDDTNNAELSQMSDSLFYNYTYVGTQTNNRPTSYRLNGNDISFYQTPDATYTIQAHMLIPQSDLSLATDTLTVNERVVVLGAYALALNERGEDSGTLSDTAAQRFNNALVDAISQDESRTINETTWYAS